MSVGALFATNPIQGPQVSQQTGGRLIDYWDPAPIGAKGPDDQPVLYGRGPTYLSNRWDTIRFNSVQMPGLWKVAKGAPSLQVDQQKGPGHDGARLALRGVLPAEIEMSVTLWTQAQWDAFVAAVPIFWRAPTKDPKEIQQIAKELKISAAEARLYQSSMYVSHPALDIYGITNVIVRQPSVPTDGPIRGTKVVTFSAIQHLPPSADKKAPRKLVDVTVHKDVRRSETEVEPPHKTGVGPRGANHSRR